MERRIVRPSATDLMPKSQEPMIASGTSYEEIKLTALKSYLPQYLEESLRQSRQTFSLSMIATFALLGLGVVGGGLLLLGKTTEGSVTSGIAAIVGGPAALAIKESKDTMNRNVKELNFLLNVRSDSDQGL